MDIDLEKFFDRVNHDKLMSALAKEIEDKRVLKLIRAFLNCGVMENGLVSPSDERVSRKGGAAFNVFIQYRSKRIGSRARSPEPQVCEVRR